MFSYPQNILFLSMSTIYSLNVYNPPTQFFSFSVRFQVIFCLRIIFSRTTIIKIQNIMSLNTYHSPRFNEIVSFSFFFFISCIAWTFPTICLCWKLEVWLCAAAWIYFDRLRTNRLRWKFFFFSHSALDQTIAIDVIRIVNVSNLFGNINTNEWMREWPTVCLTFVQC